MKPEHGKPISVPYVHRRSAVPTQNYGERFGQDVEPAGKYIAPHYSRAGADPESIAGFVPTQGEKSTKVWYEYGTAHFKKPWVHVMAEGESPIDWKRHLSAANGGKKGRRLSQHLISQGYDGVVVWNPRAPEGHISEMVDLAGRTVASHPMPADAPVPKLKKAEPLAKRIADLPRGRQLEDPSVAAVGGTVHDYDHFLNPMQRALGYQIRVHVPMARHQAVAEVKLGGKRVGITSFELDRPGVAGVGYASLDAPHRGRGLGRAMYEAAMNHAHHDLGVDQVEGGQHSSDAHRVHQSLARHHGFAAPPTTASYSYSLKSELTPAGRRVTLKWLKKPQVDKSEPLAAGEYSAAPAGDGGDELVKDEGPDPWGRKAGHPQFNQPMKLPADHLWVQRGYDMFGRSVDHPQFGVGMDAHGRSAGHPQFGSSVAPKPVKKPRAVKAKPARAKELAVVHNLSQANLEHADQLGGLAAPSIAILHQHHPFNEFGEVSLVADPELVNPEHTPVFAADAYSPRHPRPRYQLNDKEVRKLQGWLKPHLVDVGENRQGDYSHDTSYMVPEEVEKSGHQSIADHRSLRAALGKAFLEERGIHLEIPRQKARLYHEWADTPAIHEFKAAHPNPPSTTITNPGAPPEDPPGWHEIDNPEFIAYEKELGKAAHKAIGQYGEQMKALFPDEDKSYWDHWVDKKRERTFLNPDVAEPDLLQHRLHDDMKLLGQTEPDKEAARKLIEAKTDEVEQKEPGAFERWRHAKFKPLEGKPYIPKYTNNGNVRKIPYTIDNILKEVTSGIQNAEGFNYGLGSARSMGAKKFKSLDDIVREQPSLVPREEFEKLRDVQNEKYSKLVDSVESEASRQPGAFSDFHSNIIGAIGASYKRGGSLAQALKKEAGINWSQLSQGVRKQLAEFAVDLLAMPTQYFEAKPQRVVGINEFKGAVVPHDVRPETLQLLKRHGIKHIETYQRNDGKDRARAVAAVAAKRKLLLAEPGDQLERLEKAVADLPEGKPVAGSVWKRDYSHLLPPTKSGEPELALHAYHTSRVGGGHDVVAMLGYAGAGGKTLGYVSAATNGGDPALRIGNAKLEESWRGRGLGSAMYEALLQHAHQQVGVREVAGSEHSTQAHRVHEALSRKHGLKYSADPTGRVAQGKSFPWDDAFSSYRYELKAELDSEVRCPGCGSKVGDDRATDHRHTHKCRQCNTDFTPGEDKGKDLLLQEYPSISKSDGDPEVALIMAYDGYGRLLLGRRKDTGDWTMPGGHLNAGEDPEVGARRELLEETGLAPEGLTKLQVRPNPPGRPVLHVYSCQVSGMPHGRRDPDQECSEWKFIDVRDGVPKNIWARLHGPKDGSNVVRQVLELKKSERVWLDAGFAVMEKAIKDIPAGKPTDFNWEGATRGDTHDYSHLLSPEHRQAGYSLRVHVPAWGMGDVDAGIVKDGKMVGRVSGEIGDDKKLRIGTATVQPEHRGKGLGSLGYEALFAHAYHGGVRRVSGDNHSTMAHAVHQKLAAKHGLAYEAKDRLGQQGVEGPDWDERYGSYNYELKSELAKASVERCDKCRKHATKRALHAEGMAYIPSCDDHFTEIKRELGDDFSGLRPIKKAEDNHPPQGLLGEPAHPEYERAKAAGADLRWRSHYHVRYRIHGNHEQAAREASNVAMPNDPTRVGHAYRGIDQAEHDSIAQSGQIKSNMSACLRGEGTCFGHGYGDAESYAAGGDRAPETSGTKYVLEVAKGPDIKHDPRDGYLKTLDPDVSVPASRITRAWRLNRRADTVFGGGRPEEGTWQHGVGFKPLGKTEMAKSEVTELLRHPDPRERALALKLDSTTPADLCQAVLDPDPWVWRAAFHHPSAAPALDVLASASHDSSGVPCLDRHDALLQDHRLRPDHVVAMHRAVSDAVTIPVETRAARVQALEQHPLFRQHLDGLAKAEWADQRMRQATPSKPTADASREVVPPRLQHLAEAFGGTKVAQDPLQPGNAGLSSPGVGSQKVVYTLQVPGHREPQKVMVKPYSSFLRKLEGWSELTNQAVYHAAGLGHLHQDVFPVAHGSGDHQVPAIGIHIVPAQEAHNVAPKDLHPDAEQEARKIDVMDFLSGNTDRKGANLLVRPDGHLLAIDHSSAWTGGSSPFSHRFGLSHGAYGGTSSVAAPDPTGAAYGEAFRWWGQVGPDVRRTVDQRLGLVTDPGRQSTLRRGFEARAAWLDARHAEAMEGRLPPAGWRDEDVRALPMAKALQGVGMFPTGGIGEKSLSFPGSADTSTHAAAVDHAALKSAHPPAVEARRQHFETVLNAPGQVHNEEHGFKLEGIEKKALYSHGEHRYMLKGVSHPSGNEAWGPSQAWNELSSQALYHAAGIGHLHQGVHLTDARGPVTRTVLDEQGDPVMEPHPNPDPGWGALGKVREKKETVETSRPALVVHIAPDHLTAHEVGRESDGLPRAKPHRDGRYDKAIMHHTNDLGKIWVMDRVTGNTDRHNSNLLLGPHGQPLAIDHGVAFGDDWYYARNTDIKQPDGLGDFYKASLTSVGSQRPEVWSWYQERRPKIVEAMDKQLEMVQDPGVRSRMRDSFRTRLADIDKMSDKAGFPVDG
jgi:ADP-ribose pyrophosphatase YjhB (NUDIX family)/GNAT superfamily N-acetyltransferase